jgi:hypothetical protein
MNKSWFFSKTKAGLLLLLYQNPNQEYHMRALARLLNEHINGVREALLYFCGLGVLTSRILGKKVLFQANHQYLFFDELLRMVNKQTGLGARLIKEKLHLGKIEHAYLTEDYFRQTTKNHDQVVLLIVGTVSLSEIDKLVKEEGEKRQAEINYAVLSPQEFTQAQKNRDLFVSSFLQKNRLVLIGK